MGSLNKVQLIGFLGKDPETRATADGSPVCNLRIATDESYTPKGGEKQEITTWHSVSFFGRTAETANEFLRKGSQVYVEGPLRMRKYQDKEGVEKTSYEVRGEKLVLLGKASDRAE